TCRQSELGGGPRQQMEPLSRQRLGLRFARPTVLACPTKIGCRASAAAYRSRGREAPQSRSGNLLQDDPPRGGSNAREPQQRLVRPCARRLKAAIRDEHDLLELRRRRLGWPVGPACRLLEVKRKTSAQVELYRFW